MSEALQWAAIAALSLLLLGVLRQTALALPAEFRAESGGPPIRRRLPTKLLRRVEESLGNPESLDGTVVAFVTESCRGCHQLLATIAKHPYESGERRILVAREPSDAFRSALSELPVPVIFDESGDLWEASNVTGTPLVIALDAQGRVTAKELTHDVSRLASAPA